MRLELIRQESCGYVFAKMVELLQLENFQNMQVGYVSSNIIYYDGNAISKLAKTDSLGDKDAVILKLDSSGDYEWGIRNGGHRGGTTNITKKGTTKRDEFFKIYEDYKNYKRLYLKKSEVTKK